MAISVPACPHKCGNPAEFLQTPTYDSQKWELSCKECTAEPAYYIPLSQAQTPANALNWLHHLSDKPWVSRHGLETLINRFAVLYPETGIH